MGIPPRGTVGGEHGEAARRDGEVRRKVDLDVRQAKERGRAGRRSARSIVPRRPIRQHHERIGAEIRICDRPGCRIIKFDVVGEANGHSDGCCCARCRMRIGRDDASNPEILRQKRARFLAEGDRQIAVQHAVGNKVRCIRCKGGSVGLDHGRRIVGVHRVPDIGGDLCGIGRLIGRGGNRRSATADRIIAETEIGKAVCDGIPDGNRLRRDALRRVGRCDDGVQIQPALAVGGTVIVERIHGDIRPDFLPGSRIDSGGRGGERVLDQGWGCGTGGERPERQEIGDVISGSADRRVGQHKEREFR